MFVMEDLYFSLYTFCIFKNVGRKIFPLKCHLSSINQIKRKHVWPIWEKPGCTLLFWGNLIMPWLTRFSFSQRTVKNEINTADKLWQGAGFRKLPCCLPSWPLSLAFCMLSGSTCQWEWWLFRTRWCNMGMHSVYLCLLASFCVCLWFLWPRGL